MGLRDALGQGYYRAGQDEVALEMFPAWELVDTNPGKTEGRRDWSARWLAAGGTFWDGRMIALKTDPIWERLSRFKQPWAPFDYGSYWDVKSVDYDTAVEAGVLKRGEVPEPSVKDWNATLEASLPDASGNYGQLLQATFGDQLQVGRDGKLIWQGSRVAKLYNQALSDNSVQWALDLGKATADTLAKAQAGGVTLAPGTHLKLSADAIRHAAARHGEPGGRGVGTGETDGSQRPLTSLDFELIPHVWRDPDEVRPADKPGAIELVKRLAGKNVVIVYDLNAKNPLQSVKTTWVKKERSAP
jgi:hypothetical protein